MKFTVIIPTLNEEKNIVSCLLPLQDLRKNCQIIVVDGDSTDNTEILANPLCDQMLTASKGRATQMNFGAAQAEGEVLVFLHADTLLPLTALDHIEQSVNARRQWGRFDIELSGSHAMLKVIAFFMNWRSRLTGIATGDQVLFVTKQYFDKVGGYPDIPLMEDIALCKKLKPFSPPICLKAKVISSGRRWEQFGVFKTILLMWSLRLRYFFGADPEVLALAYKEGKLWKV